MDNVILGTELKLNVHIPPMGNVHASGYNFEVAFYCTSTKKITLTKEQLLPIDDDNFLARLNTEDVGTGELKCRITAHIPDDDFEDRLRTEVVQPLTNITIIKAR